MTKEKSKKIIQILKKYYGNVKAQLSHTSIYELVIAVVLSAQTTDKQVNSVTPALFKKYPDFKSLSKAQSGTVETIIKSVGLFKTKAKNIISLAKYVSNDLDNQLPVSLEGLMSLPGIGRKSANVIISIGYNKPAIAVDTHVLRIANRVGYVQSNNTLKAEKALMNFIPEKDWTNAHLLLIKHGRNICGARNPLCPECPIIKLCDYPNT